MKDKIKVVVTGAAGQISYSLIPRLVDGNTFGDKIVDLELVEIPQVVDKLEGLVMELEDSNFPKMGNVNYTSNFEEAAQNAACTWRWWPRSPILRRLINGCWRKGKRSTIAKP